MNVLVLGAGLMGAEIGCEYALGQHDVTLHARDLDAVAIRVERVLQTLSEHGLRSPKELAAASDRITYAGAVRATATPYDFVIESLPEILELKGRMLAAVAEASPRAVLATNTSSLRVTEIAEAAGAPERTVGTHYWNPPTLMPLVEIIPGTRTSPETVTFVVELVTSLGKRPVTVRRDAPGFIWNRLQLAVLRECAWIIENGVAAPETVDEVIRHGLARRWRHVGPLATMALGGVDTWNRVAANVVPSLSAASSIPDVSKLLPSGLDAEAQRRRRDAALADEVKRERHPNDP